MPRILSYINIIRKRT